MKLSAFQVTHYLLLLTVAVLVAFGVGSLLLIRADSDLMALYVFYALAMFGDAALMVFSAWQLNRRTKFIFFFSVIVLGLNIILTAFDQFGLVDLLFVLLNAATLAALIFARKEFPIA